MRSNDDETWTTSNPPVAVLEYNDIGRCYVDSQITDSRCEEDAFVSGFVVLVDCDYSFFVRCTRIHTAIFFIR